MAKNLRVLVTGATGKQGGAVADRLLDRGHTVRALTRDPASKAAKALAERGVDVRAGSLEDRASLDRAIEGTDAVFAVTTPFEAGVAAETQQGVTIADAAKAAGVHLVYTSVGCADRGTGIPHFESKYTVEQHITRIGVPATIIAPVFFMENPIAFGLEHLKQGVYGSPLAPDRKLAQVALVDIASFTTLALENRDRFLGTRYDIAGDDLSGAEAAEILSRATGRKIAYFQVPMEMIRQGMGDDGVSMFQWFERVGYDVDRAQLRREFPEVGWHSYEAWARSQDWTRILA